MTSDRKFKVEVDVIGGHWPSTGSIIGLTATAYDVSHRSYLVDFSKRYPIRIESYRDFNYESWVTKSCDKNIGSKIPSGNDRRILQVIHPNEKICTLDISANWV
jgi:hypothetical protein